MNAEFNPIAGRADIISSMADSVSKSEQGFSENSDLTRRKEPAQGNLADKGVSRNEIAGQGFSRVFRTGQPRELSFKDTEARNVAGLIVRIQNNDKTHAYLDEVDSLDKFLKTNVKEEAIPGKKMFAERVVMAQGIFRNVTLTDIPEKPDLDEKVAVAELRRVGAEDEESLTVEAVKDRVTAQVARKVDKKPSHVSHVEAGKKVETKPGKSKKLTSGQEQPKYIVESSTRLEQSAGEDVVRILEEQGVPIKPDIENWDKAGIVRRKKWLKESRIFNIAEFPLIEGGAVVYGDTQSIIDTDLLRRRLEELDQREQVMGGGFDGHLDRQEIFERIEVLNREKHAELLGYFSQDRYSYENLRKVVISDTLSQLKTLRSIERAMNDPVGFNSTYGRVRFELNSTLADYSSAESIIEGLLFLETSTGPNSQSITDEIDALHQSLAFQVDLVRTKASALKDGFNFVNHFSKTIDTQEKLVKGDADLEATLERILPEVVRTEMKNLARAMDSHFNSLAEGMGREAKNRFFSELDKEATSLEGSYRIGTLRIEGFDKKLYEFALSRVESRGREGLSEWRAAITVEGFERGILSEAELGVPRNWRDSERNADYNFRFVESSDLSVDELGKAIQRVAAIAEALAHVKGVDEEEARQMKEMIDKKRFAVRGKYLYRKAMLDHDSDPEKVDSVFSGDDWTDETNKVYQDRFDVDHNGRKFIRKDANDNEFTFNIKDLGERIFEEVLRGEKELINLIEGLSLVDINHEFGLGNSRMLRPIEDLLRRTLTQSDIDALNSLRLNFYNRIKEEKKISERDPVPPDAEIDREVNAYWADPGKAKGIVNAWLREETLVGAHGEFLDVPADSTREPERKLYLDEQKKRIEEMLKIRLASLGVDADKIQEYIEAGVISQAVNVAYYDKWMDGSFSENGLVRLYDRKSEWFVQKNAHIWDGNRYIQRDAVHYVPREFAYSGHTNLFHQRMVDFSAEFLIDELRGRTGKGVHREIDADYVFQKHMLGKRRGILHNNRMRVKLINEKFREGDFSNQLLTNTGRERMNALGIVNFSDFLGDYIKRLDNIEKLDINSDDWDMAWARGVALAEMLEDGLISLENINMSEAYRNNDTNVTKYNLIDWKGDQKAEKGYISVKALQGYLKNPNTKTFFEINSDEFFYSKRENRLKPWSKLVIPAHLELGEHWKDWWKLPYNMMHAEKDEVIEYAVETNRLEAEAEERLKNELLKWGPLRGLWGVGPVNVENIKALWETAKVTANETKKALPLIFFLLLWGLVQEMFSQSKPELSRT